MSSLKAQASGLVAFITKKIESLQAGKQSEWIKADEAAKAASVSVGELKKVLRRPRVKTMLEKAGIGCSFRGEFIYAYKDTGFGNDPGEAVATPADPGKSTVDYSLDPNYYWMPKYTDDMLKVLDAGMNVFMVGPAGTGKSTFLRKLCDKRSTKYYFINLNGEISVDDLIGVKDIENGQTVFTEGVLPKSMREGVPLIIDEMDAAPPDVLFVLQNVLEGVPLCLSKKGAEYVTPEPGFCVLSTANTLGRGDDSGLYAGTNFLNEAFLDRFGVVVDCWYMPADEEVRVLVKRTGTHKRAAEKMVKLANVAREAMRADRLVSTFSTRKLLSWCALVAQGVELKEAFRYTCLSKVSTEDKKALAEMAQRVFGAALDINLDSF